MARPRLSAFPYLHNLLRSDVRLNREFNAYLSGVTGGSGSTSAEQELQDQIVALRERLKTVEWDAGKVEAKFAKAVRAVKLLGEHMEVQLKLSPYTQDILEKRKYSIEFDGAQIRLLTYLYWDLVSDQMEEVLAGVVDPADEGGEK